MENIVRYLSDSPRAENWSVHLEVDYIFELYSVQGQLSAFLHSRFTRLYLHTGTLIDVNDLVLGKELVISCRIESVLDWPQHLGQHFHTIIIGSSFYFSKQVYQQAGFLSNRCPNITSLYMRCDGAHGRIWVRAFGANVTKIHVETGHRLREIAEFCPKLLEITLAKPSWCDHESEAFWRKVGKTVEKISTVFMTGGSKEIDLIETHCRKIKHANFTMINCGLNERISKCLASFGGQLEQATVQFMSKEQLERVRAACPNARLNLIISAPDQYIEDDQLGEVEVRFKASSSNTTADWRECTKIEKVQFTGEVSTADVRAVFKKKKPQLKYIAFTVGRDSEDLEEIISLIAHGTGRLETLHVIGPKPRHGIFDELVEKNKHLSWVRFYSYEHLAVRGTVDILKSFLKSPSLARMELFDGRLGLATEFPKAISHANRFRRVCISIAGEAFIS